MHVTKEKSYAWKIIDHWCFWDLQYTKFTLLLCWTNETWQIKESSMKQHLVQKWIFSSIQSHLYSFFFVSPGPLKTVEGFHWGIRNGLHSLVCANNIWGMVSFQRLLQKKGIKGKWPLIMKLALLYSKNEKELVYKGFDSKSLIISNLLQSVINANSSH